MTDEAITIMARAMRRSKAWPVVYQAGSAAVLATAALEALRAAGYWVGPPPHGLSVWPGWDRSGGSWSAACHQDSVCAAVFRDGYAAEDARALISFIDRTWGSPPVQSEGGDG